MLWKDSPILNEIGIQTYFNGPESFTPDDRYYLGKVPYKDNVFVSTGFNSIGVQSAGGVGKVMAEWIINDMSNIDLWDVDIARVLDFQDNDNYLRERSTESLGLLYKIHWPFYQYETSRDQIKSPLHTDLENHGACFGELADGKGQIGMQKTKVKRNTNIHMVDKTGLKMYEQNVIMSEIM